MKKLLLSFIFLISVSLASTAPADLFAKANAYYEKQQYSKALKYYQNIVKQEVYSKGVLYNLGNAYFKLGQVAQARLSWEKALLLSPKDKNLKANLYLLKNYLEDKEDKKPRPLSQAYAFTYSFLNAYQWIMVSFGLFITLNLLFAVFFLKRYSWLKVVSILLGGCLILVSAIAFEPVRYFLNPDQAVIMSERIEVKSGPDNKYAVLFVLHKGSKVEVVKSHDRWVNVTFNDSLSGWIPKAKMKFIEL
jgi:tetratricopeptide (TPR) repeat protein